MQQFSYGEAENIDRRNISLLDVCSCILASFGSMGAHGRWAHLHLRGVRMWEFCHPQQNVVHN